MENIVFEEKRVHSDGLPRKNSLRYVSEYANLVEADAGFDELRLVFSKVARGLDRGVVEVEQAASIWLAWSQAARFSDMLRGVIEAYEAKFGPITRRRVQDPQADSVEHDDL